MNFKYLLLSERTQREKPQTVGFQQYDLLGKAQRGDHENISGCQECAGEEMNRWSTCGVG